MLTRRSAIIGASAFALAGHASAVSLAAFSISQIAASVWPFAVWPSTSQKVARNKFGTFYVVGVASGNPAAATPTTFTLFWDKADGNGPQAEWTQSLGTNMVNLEAFESGEVCVTYSNFTLGTLFTYCWQDITASIIPVGTQINGYGSAGKTGTVVDDARRCIHVMGLSKNYARLSTTGALECQQTMLSAGGTDQAEYFNLSLDDGGNLYVVMNLATSASPPEYDAVTAIMSPNPSDSPPSWYNGSLALGSQLTVPINPALGNGTVSLTIGEQMRNFNNYLMGHTVSEGTMHVLLGQTPALTERAYAFNDFRDLTVEAIALPWTNNQAYRNAVTHRSLRGQTLIPKCAYGGICQRGDALYAVLHDRTNLICLRSTDNGEKWNDYAVTDLKPYLGAGTDVSTWWTPRDLGIMRGRGTDTDIIGMFTIMQCNPEAWAKAPFGFSPPSSAYTFSLPVP